MQTVFKFLKQLKANNNKDWFDKNKVQFLKAKEEFEVFVDDLIKGIRKFDKKLEPGLTAKKCVFRIYRDVRFSKDKTPYKIFMSADINPGGKGANSGGYYIQIQPGENFLAGGIYDPTPEMLQAIRQEIDYNPKAITKILNSASFKKYFKGFDVIDPLKTAPKGFEKDHPQLELLKNRHFIVSHELSDKEILSPGSDKKVVEGFKAMHPLIEYLREATHK